MKRGLITLLVIAMLACIGLVSCKNEVQAPAEELVSVSFDKDSSRSLSSNLEKFEPEKYYWKYAAKKADGSNLISGQTASYDEAGALWIKEGKPGFSDTQGKYKVQGFSQGLWNFTLYGYKWTDSDNDQQIDEGETVLVYSGETTGHLLKSGDNNTHSVSVVVSPAQGGNGTLWVKITGEDAIYLDRAMPIEAAANVKEKLTVQAIGAAEPIIDGFVTADYKPSLPAGSYRVTVQFTNDDGGVVFASGSVVATVYSGLTTTIKGNLTEVVTYADFGAEQNPDIITTTIGTATAIAEGSTSEAPVELVKKSQTATDKVTASLSNTAAQALIANLKEELDADATASSMMLNLSVDTTEATETTITYEIGMEAVLSYTKNSVSTQTTSTVKEVADYVTIEISMQAGLTDVSVTHSGNDMTSGEQWAEKTSRTTLELSDFLANAGTEANPDPDGYYYYYEYSSNNGTVKDKATLYIKTKTFSPFKLSYTVPEAVAAIGSKTYTSLAAAVGDANVGDTVTLLKNTTVESAIAITKSITIDLNGNEITNKVKENRLFRVSGVTFKLENGTVTTPDDFIYSFGFVDLRDVSGSASEEAELIVEDMTFYGATLSGSLFAYRKDGQSMSFKDVVVTVPKGTGQKYKYDNWVHGNTYSIVNGQSYQVTLTITGGTFNYDSRVLNAGVFQAGIYDTDYYQENDSTKVYFNGIVVNSTSGPVLEGHGTVEYVDCSFNNSTSQGSYLNSSVAVALGGKLTVSELTYSADYGAYVWSSGGEINIKSGSFSGTEAALYAQTDVSSYPAATAVINVTDGTFSGKIKVDGKSTIRISGGAFTNTSFSAEGVAEGEGYGIIITGGTFDADPSAYVASGCDVNYYSETNRWVVYPAVTVVHSSLETGYGTFAAALNAAQNGDTLVINKDISLTSSNSLSKSITLNLNGNTIASTKPFFTVGSNVNLTIMDSGDNGKINVSLGSDWNNDCLIDSRNSGSKVIIEGGSLAVERTAGSGKSTYGVRLSSDSSFEMKGGTIRVTGLGGGAYSWTASNNYYGVSNSGSGSVIISDGEIVCESAGSNYALSSSAGTVLISGGRIESTNKNNSAKAPYAVEIKGGTAEITGGTIVVDDRDTFGWSDAHLAYGVSEISGGTFISPKTLDITDVRNRLASGCALEDMGNNTWRVYVKTVGPISADDIIDDGTEF